MGFIPSLLYGCSSVGRALVSKTRCREFEPLYPCKKEEINAIMKKIKAYFANVYDELVRKVTWPKWSELQSSAIVVMVASLIFALVIFVMDFAFKGLLEWVYGLFY